MKKTIFPLSVISLPLVPRINFFLRLILFNLFYFFLFRLAFFIAFYPPQAFPSWSETFYAFYLGGKFDLRLILLLLTPALLLSSVPAFSPENQPRGRKGWTFSFLFLLAIPTILTLFDFGHYSYLKARINSSVLTFLENPLISMEMVWQTYPVIRLLLFLGFSLWVYFQFIRKVAYRPFQFTYELSSSVDTLSRKNRVLQWTLLLCLWAGGLYGKLSFYPLRWSEAYFSTDSFVSSLSLNPVMYFFETLGLQEEGYDLSLVKKYYPDVARFLGKEIGEGQGEKEPSFSRVYHPEKKFPGNPNIVVIVMESMAAFKSGYFGNPLNPTPYLDQLIKESLTFTRFYVPVQATARSIFAAVTGIPDLSRKKTNSRNPMIVNQNSIINDLEGMEKFYFLGGSANWGNIRSIFSHNIKDIKILEEGSFSSPRSDVWGLSDYHLFIEANAVLKKQDKPFFAFIQSASYHRPYTIPRDKGEFQVDSLKGKESLLGPSGMESVDEYNSLRFQDYSLGNFFKLAKKEKYYQNTIFLILGDHGLPVNNASHVPLGERVHDLENFHVPFLVHAPQFFPPGTNEKFVSELDLTATVAGLLGKPYFNNGLGRDIFDPQFDNKRKVFTYYWYITPPTFGILDEKFYFVGNTEGRSELYLYRTDKPLENVAGKFPEELKERENLGQGLYHTSRYLRFFNDHSRHNLTLKASP